MLKTAYQLGIKLALLEEAGATLEQLDDSSELAQLLQQLPEDKPADTLKQKKSGEPVDDLRYGSPSENYAFDDLSHLGLDIQGPDSTAV